MNIEKILSSAAKAAENAYAPYSGFKVGASILTSSDNIYTGCNIENSSYGLTVCAERVAVFKAVSAGEREFKSLAIYAQTDDFCPPCGACRQVLIEFGRDIQVFMFNKSGDYKAASISELMPLAFDAGML